ncbi:MAG: tagaturonate epimerase family protein [Candidatus Thorarchaeota archaeon]
MGRFEKAIDYIGDLKEFEESFKKHVSIANAS